MDLDCGKKEEVCIGDKWYKCSWGSGMSLLAGLNGSGTLPPGGGGGGGGGGGAPTAEAMALMKAALVVVVGRIVRKGEQKAYVRKRGGDDVGDYQI